MPRAEIFMMVDHQRIPRARNAREVTQGFLACREARVTLVALVLLWGAAWRWAGVDARVPLSVLSGFCFWYLIEIPIHRWVLHASLPANPVLAKLLKRLHYNHHQRPTDPTLLFLPEWVALPSIGILLGFFSLIGFPLQGLWFMAGFWLSLTSYEWMHYAVHSRWRPRWAPLRHTFENHMLHHFRNEAHWFGVSNSVMDRLWRTAPPPDTVPRSHSARNLAAAQDD